MDSYDLGVWSLIYWSKNRISVCHDMTKAEKWCYRKTNHMCTWRRFKRLRFLQWRLKTIYVVTVAYGFFNCKKCLNYSYLFKVQSHKHNATSAKAKQTTNDTSLLMEGLKTYQSGGHYLGTQRLGQIPGKIHIRGSQPWLHTRIPESSSKPKCISCYTMLYHSRLWSRTQTPVLKSSGDLRST